MTINTGPINSSIMMAVSSLTPSITTLTTITALGVLGGSLASMPAAALGVGIGIAVSPLVNRAVAAIHIGLGKLSTGIHALFKTTAAWVSTPIFYVKESLLGWNGRIAAQSVATHAATPTKDIQAESRITNPFDPGWVDEENPVISPAMPAKHPSTNPFDEDFVEAENKTEITAAPTLTKARSTNPFDPDFEEEPSLPSFANPSTPAAKPSTNPFDEDFVDDSDK